MKLMKHMTHDTRHMTYTHTHTHIHAPHTHTHKHDQGARDTMHDMQCIDLHRLLAEQQCEGTCLQHFEHLQRRRQDVTYNLKEWNVPFGHQRGLQTGPSSILKGLRCSWRMLARTKNSGQGPLLQKEDSQKLATMLLTTMLQHLSVVFKGKSTTRRFCLN